MSYAIVFSSKTGNTKLLADTLHACLPQENCCYFGTPDPAAMEADDLYVGFWTDKGNADESTLDFLKQLHGKNIFLFGTAGFGGSEEYFNKILKKVERSLDRSNTVFGRYMCQGKMPLSVRQRYEGMKKQPWKGGDISYHRWRSPCLQLYVSYSPVLPCRRSSSMHLPAQ